MRFRQIALLAILAVDTGLAQAPGSLKRVSVPQPAGLERYVRSNTALVILGKALFWDMQAGSDGRTACASCHFHAGADHRKEAQLARAESPSQLLRALTSADFPFHSLSDPGNNRSAVLRDTQARMGSAGVFKRVFRDVNGTAADDGSDSFEPSEFTLNGIHLRQVTTRNSPTVINSVFNYRNFWDGRASNVFTVRTPFGESDRSLNALTVSDGAVTAERIRMENASLASQAVGPPLNGVEMSYEGRSWPHLGKKMLALRPLALQAIAADDSVLGPFADGSGRGFQSGVSYLTLVREAFQPAYWDTDALVDSRGALLSRRGSPEPGEFTVAEFNFALFWGLALQAYQATLVADDSRVDRFFDGDQSALTPIERRGLDVFRGRGAECTQCHTGPEFSLAGITSVAQRGSVSPAGGGPRGNAIDTGFFRIGVRPIGEDAGLGATDDFGFPLSIAASGNPNLRGATQGLFKTPGLRNVEMTGPYFHNGGQATLEQVVEFYNRGGDFPQGGNLGPDIGPRNLSEADRTALVAFLKALSDERVRFEKAPFDHPEICVPVGYERADSLSPLAAGSSAGSSSSAAERWAGIPAVGAGGNATPLQTFEELLADIGTDGTRSHTLKDACAIP